MSDYFLGEIRLLAFDQFAPVNFLPCDGRLLGISQYQALFSLLGTTYGGDGVSTFGIPDLRGRSPVHKGQTTGGGTNYALGQSAGAELVTLTLATVPPHTHTISALNSTATAMIPASNNAPANVGSDFYYCNESQAGTMVTLAPGSVITNGGSNQPHLNVQPSLVLSYVMAVNGTYPDFNS